MLALLSVQTFINNNNKKCGLLPLLQQQLLPIRLWLCVIFPTSSHRQQQQLIQQQQRPCTLIGTVNNGYLIIGRLQCSIRLFSLINKRQRMNNNRHLLAQVPLVAILHHLLLFHLMAIALLLLKVPYRHLSTCELNSPATNYNFSSFQCLQ